MQLRTEARGPVRTLIVDSQPLFRQGLRWTLDAFPDVTVVGEAGDRASAMQVARETHPDIILCASDLASGDGLLVAQLLQGRHPRAAIIVLIPHEDADLRGRAQRLALASCLAKDALDASDLLQVLRRLRP